MLTILTTGALSALVLAAAATDLRSRRIPNALTLAGLGIGLALRVPLGGGAVVDGLLGAGAALLLGILFFMLRALGGGDVKLLAAVGAFTGLAALPVTLVLIAAMGGVLAFAEAVRRGVLRRVLANTGRLVLYWASAARLGSHADVSSPAAVTVPYGVAIAAGAIVGRFL